MNTMVRLKNIKKNEENHTIQADYIPEHSEEVGFVVVDYESGEIIDSKFTSYDRTFKSYCHHAAKGLRNIIRDEAKKGIPETYTAMWY